MFIKNVQHEFVMDSDLRVLELIEKEKNRQLSTLELIPSENFVSSGVLNATGSIMTNKYSEGYPGKRYYGGNEFMDIIEDLAIERAKKLFGAEHVNVQPNSGCPANMAVYFGLIETGDKIMSMSLSHGGHLSHGHKISFSGKWYEIVNYGVNEKTQTIDYDEVRKIAEKEKPKIIISGYSAYPRDVDFKQFAEIAKDVGAISMADISHVAGLIVGGVHSSPFPYTDIITTTTHKTLRGPRSAIILSKKEFGERIDKAVFPGLQGGPHMHTIAAKAQCFYEAMKPSFKKYARTVVGNNKAMEKELLSYGFELISGGSDNHLQLINVENKNLTGSEAETALETAGITVNKNMIPFDKRTPFNPSGIRLGTPAITTRGMKGDDMKKIVGWINDAIENKNDQEFLKTIKGEVNEFCSEYPLFAWN